MTHNAWVTLSHAMQYLNAEHGKPGASTVCLYNDDAREAFMILVRLRRELVMEEFRAVQA